MRRLTGSFASFFVLTTLVVACGGNASAPDAAGPACSDGVDNDGDGMIDYPADLGCESAEDTTEDSAPMPQCSDGRDNDGDGKIDFPADPGCLAAQQNDETDDCPSGPGCPECSNGRDDDGNGSMDYPGDPGCTSASDGEEFVASPVACGASLMIVDLPPSNMTTGMLTATSTSPFAPSCGGVTGAQGIAYHFHLASPRVVVVNTDGSIADTVVTIRSANCSADTAELGCNDDYTTTTASKVTVSLMGGNYYIIVQGKTAATTGAFNLTMQTFGGEGEACTDTTECGPTLVCRIPLGGTTKQCQKPMCSDGVDDDGDGKNDYPTDPGCTGLDDNDEVDDCPSGPNCPACSNGMDDDGDALTDYPADTSCQAASGNSEACNMEQDPIAPITMGTTTGTSVGAHDNHTPSCSFGTGGVDVLYTVKLPAMQTVTFDTNMSSFDTVLSLLSPSCAEPSLACDDDGGTGGGTSQITRTVLGAGTYLLAVDAYDDNEVAGPLTVHVTGTIAPGGACEASDTLGGALACPTAFPCEGTPGQMKCRTAQCSDGINNDGDTKIDYPNDPGCTGPFDDDESDPCPGAGCPACGDGIDNDGDGQIDYPNDLSCTSASAASEACSGEQDPVLTITGPASTGTLVGAHDDHNPSCGSDGGPDRIYQVSLPALQSLTLDTENSTVDTLLSFLTAACAEPSLQCDDDGGISSGASLITRTNVPAGAYTIAVDAYSSTTTLGTYNLNLHGVLTAGASCEPANTLGGALACPAIAPCAGAVGTRICQAPACSDGVDNDGDGVTDFPNDPGCTSISDNDETNPAVAPVCSNGLDDDGDGQIDFPLDTGCTSAAGTTEFCGLDPDFAGTITMPVNTGTLASAADNYDESCQANTGNDTTYRLTLPVPVASLVLDTEGSVITDTVLSLKDNNCGTQLGCDDDNGTGNLSLLTVANVAAGSYAINVEGYSSSNNGAYTLNVHGTVAAGTACTAPLFTSGVLACATGTTCTAGTCQ